MKSFIGVLKLIAQIIDTLKSYFLDMIIFINLSNKTLENKAR